jgi:colanic acid/amylovoran biosynthesis glycosyltransferase
MSVLFMMLNWHVPSEVWMQRMLEELGNDIGTIVANDTKGATRWRDHVRAVSLTPNWSFARYCYNLIPSLMPDLKLYAQTTLLKEIKRPGITQVLCHYGAFAVEFMKVWEKVDVPLYIHFHGYDATFDLRSYDNPDKRYFSDGYLLKVLKLAGRATIIANSEFTKSLLVDAGIPSDRIHIKYYGVPVPPTCKIHNNHKEINVLHLGRLVDFKSPDRTIKAFEIARSRRMNGKLIIAGDGPLRSKCELLKARSPYKDSIQILGAVTADYAKELLLDADIYTQHNIKGEISRQSECFGVSVIEAMAAGLPVIGTRSGGVNETVVDGETGILLDPGDVEGQADALYRLANDSALRQKLGYAGNRRVSENFSMAQEAKMLRMIMQL